MRVFIGFILLQIGFLSPTGKPVTGVKMQLTNAASNEVVAFTKIGFSGKFEFSNLDPGNYLLSIKIPEHSVRIVDKKEKQKFESDITVGFNSEKQSWNWHREDGFLEVGINKISKVAESFIPKFELPNQKTAPCTEENKAPTGILGKALKKSQKKIVQGEITILQFTVIDQFGTFSGYVHSVSQKTHHKMMVGTGDIKLEDLGVVTVIKRED